MVRVITSSELVGGKGHDPSGNLEPARRDGGGRREAPIQEQRLVFHEIFSGQMSRVCSKLSQDCGEVGLHVHDICNARGNPSRDISGTRGHIWSNLTLMDLKLWILLPPSSVKPYLSPRSPVSSVRPVMLRH